VAACNSGGVTRRHSRIGSNRARTHPHSPGRKAGKPRPTSAERVRSDGEELAEALSKVALALVETVSLAMRVHEHEPDLGSIAASPEVARCQLGRAHSEIDLALMRILRLRDMSDRERRKSLRR
jgi:hypothetical protein